MTDRNKKNNKEETKDKLAFSLLGKMYSVVMKECKSVPGKVNIFFDALLALLILAYIALTTIESVAIIVTSIWNSALTEYASSDLIWLILIFAIAATGCLMLMWCIMRVENKDSRNHHIEDDPK